MARTKASQTKAERSATTKRALLDVARGEFAGFGYAGAATEAIVAKAKVTRGALYYHFKDKQALFAGVVADMARDISIGMATKASEKRAPWEGLLAGCRAFLDIAAQPGILRVYLQDAPAAMGWAEWRAVDGDGAFGFLLRSFVLALQGSRKAKEGTPAALARLVAGALTEAALSIAAASDPKTARADIERALLALLVGLREHYGAAE
ncbi:MAG: TetR/AcrR family transcriptional regulator [Rhodospirillaceae bacterium]|nr:TetR/AcrR family transcriptional regulator [Rhodospirillaceae bacterium]